MRYLVIIGLSILVFLGVGWGVSAYALSVLSPTEDDVEMAIVLGPIAGGAALGLAVGLIASILTVIDRWRSKKSLNSSTDGTR